MTTLQTRRAQLSNGAHTTAYVETVDGQPGWTLIGWSSDGSKSVTGHAHTDPSYFRGRHWQDERGREFPSLKAAMEEVAADAQSAAQIASMQAKMAYPEDVIAGVLSGEGEVTDEAVAQADRILDAAEADGFTFADAPVLSREAAVRLLHSLDSLPGHSHADGHTDCEAAIARALGEYIDPVLTVTGNPGSALVGDPEEADWAGAFGNLKAEPFVHGGSRAQIEVTGWGFDEDPRVTASVELTLGDLRELRDWATRLVASYDADGDDGSAED